MLVHDDQIKPIGEYAFLRSFAFFFLIFVIFLCGCLEVATTSPAIRRPTIEDFPPQSLNYTVVCSPDDIKKNLMDFFTDEGLRTVEEITNEGIHIITVYAEEPKVGKRSREAAYMIRIAHTAESGISKVVFTWLVQSKGDYEREWNATEEDRKYSPALVSRIDQQIKKFK